MDLDLEGPISLEATLTCGQAFRWRAASFPCRPDLPISFRGVIPTGAQDGQGQLAVFVGQKTGVTREITVAYDRSHAGKLTQGDVEKAVRRYFAARDDVAAVEDALSRQDPVMSRAVEGGRGLRILEQDHWECLASYVLSVNNNIPNISRIIEYFATSLGEPVGLGLSGFPSPKEIACQDSASLRQSRCGFRDRFLLDAAQRVVSGEVNLIDLEQVSTERVRERLMRIRGVGPKVADCVLLFGYHRLDVFPVDVWIARAMSRFYLDGRVVTPKAIREEGMRRFGDLAGYAQEYLFLGMRSRLPIS